MDIYSIENWAKLTEAERIEHCLTAAQEALSQAKGASPELRAIYKNLAAQWYGLANEIEARQSGRLTG